MKRTTGLLLIILTFMQLGAIFRPISILPQSGSSYQVILHPDGQLYVGDLVSIDVISGTHRDLSKNSLQVWLDDGPQPLSDPAAFIYNDSLNTYQVRLQWIWDTKTVNIGEHVLTFKIFPGSESWQVPVSFASPALMPDSEKKARWASTSSACCQIHYLTGTAAERDIRTIARQLDAAALDISAQLGQDYNGNIQVNLIPRLLGQGGFTANEIYLTLPDDNYSGTGFLQNARHELVHYIDRRSDPAAHPLFLVEGLAVSIAGGHYLPEPVVLQASALSASGLYIPLSSLINHFSSLQHETAYIEAGAFTAYLSQRFGRYRFLSFYHNAQVASGREDVLVIDRALQKNFRISLDQAENDFRVWLDEMTVIPEIRQGVLASIRFYNDIRSYQEKYAPSTGFDTVWLPDAVEMRRKGITADYFRKDNSEKLNEIEKQFSQAGQSLILGNYADVRATLSLVEPLLHSSR
jgi:hypothetical protein